MSTDHKSPPPHDIAIMGMSCVFPDADDVEAFWHNIVSGKQSFRDIPKSRWDNEVFFSEVPRDIDRSYVKKGAFIDSEREFAALTFGIAPRRVGHMDPQHRLLLHSVREALQDAGYEQGGSTRPRSVPS